MEEGKAVGVSCARCSTAGTLLLDGEHCMRGVCWYYTYRDDLMSGLVLAMNEDLESMS